MPSDQFQLTRSRAAVLQVSVLVVALCGIVYELLIATVSAYLLGDSVRQFSITIGLFMAAMGLGAISPALSTTTSLLALSSSKFW
ncbi:hypothetical protein H206_00898 [Candidatus Electrothrix aarhusensis]|uniref:Spermidine synthase n=1 Tax=Candidatus Electrothrix aarhusensis TaxID=1859131 RepID=A0A3S3U9V1_9BACT|nr:hypothetical protein H206_00898 [Candidatus Electrothrix aarhusensis]